MGFFVVGRRRDDGTLVLISPKLFDSRQLAVDELSNTDVAPTLESECYVVDLDSATPVLVVHASGRAADSATAEGSEAASAETAGVWEAPPEEEPSTAVDVEAVDQAFAEAVLAQEGEPAEGAEEPLEGEPELADALKRAAGSMESEGITAPESIGPATVQTEEVLPEAAEETALSEGAKGWPWDAKHSEEAETAATVEPAKADEGEVPAKEEPLPFVPDALEEPATDINELVTGRAEEGAFDIAKPVIMGSYGDEEASGTQAVAEAEAPAADEPLPVVEPPAEQEEAEDLAGVIADLELDQELAEAGETTQAEDVPSGEIGQDVTDVASLTCDDCVYLKTCPNKGELTPATCGSFQWKSS